MKILISFLLFFPAVVLAAQPALYEGFDMAGSPGTSIGTDTTGGGAGSKGWMSGWFIKDGRSQYLRDDLGIPGFRSEEGLVKNRGRTVVMRQLGESFTGDVYGSFRVSAGQLKKNSILSLLISLPREGEHKVNPKTALFGFLAKRWGSPLGAISLGGDVMKMPDGAGMEAGEDILVLWKVAGIPEPGKSSDQEISLWILSRDQATHFAREGMEEEDLAKAGMGRDAGQVLQSMNVSLKNSKLSLMRGLVVSCFSYQIPDARFDEIRISRDSLADAAGVGGPVPSEAASEYGKRPAKDTPNILFITMDDMNYDSINSYGSSVPGISPHIDSLAEDGMRLYNAYNQTSSCVPSRNAYQTGRYPHSIGLLSFYNVDIDGKTLPEILREEGYVTAVINKPRDTSPTDHFDRYWDFHKIMKGAAKRGPVNYAAEVNRFFDEIEGAENPFYCVVNIADPHKPFFNDAASKKKGFDKYAPSTIYETSDVEIPAFLPEHPEIHEEMRNYYNSVKRGDDCVGAVLDTLKERGYAEDTVVIFVSDHGMPLPYAKSSLYPDGLRTPLIVRWPGAVEPGSEDSDHMVSAIDFMPTVLEIAEARKPSDLPGQSYRPVLEGWTVAGMDEVFAEFNDNAGGRTFPMRAIHTERYVYVFNAWGTGEHEFVSASTWHKTENVMKRLARTDPEVAERYDFLRHRTVEELYDTQKDPHALNNLVDDPDYVEIADSLRQRLENWMIETDDYVLEAYHVRDDLEKLNAWMEQADAAAIKRAETLQWKRYKNRAGGTGKNTKLYRKD